MSSAESRILPLTGEELERCIDIEYEAYIESRESKRRAMTREAFGNRWRCRWGINTKDRRVYFNASQSFSLEHNTHFSNVLNEVRREKKEQQPTEGRKKRLERKRFQEMREEWETEEEREIERDAEIRRMNEMRGREGERIEKERGFLVGQIVREPENEAHWRDMLDRIDPLMSDEDISSRVSRTRREGSYMSDDDLFFKSQRYRRDPPPRRGDHSSRGDG